MIPKIILALLILTIAAGVIADMRREYDKGDWLAAVAVLLALVLGAVWL